MSLDVAVDERVPVFVDFLESAGALPPRETRASCKLWPRHLLSAQPAAHSMIVSAFLMSALSPRWLGLERHATGASRYLRRTLRTPSCWVPVSLRILEILQCPLSEEKILMYKFVGAAVLFLK